MPVLRELDITLMTPEEEEAVLRALPSLRVLNGLTITPTAPAPPPPSAAGEAMGVKPPPPPSSPGMRAISLTDSDVEQVALLFGAVKVSD